MTGYEQLLQQLPQSPKVWLVTGVAGFIGSNLLETPLELYQQVIVLNHFAAGYQLNLDEVQGLAAPEQWARFRSIEGDICKLEDCCTACEGVDYVLHQAALGSVPRSIDDPITINAASILLTVWYLSSRLNMEKLVERVSAYCSFRQRERSV